MKAHVGRVASPSRVRTGTTTPTATRAKAASAAQRRGAGTIRGGPGTPGVWGGPRLGQPSLTTTLPLFHVRISGVIFHFGAFVGAGSFAMRSVWKKKVKKISGT